MDVLEKMARKVSKNNTKQCFALKCDIKKFFESIDHKILLEIIDKKIKDNNCRWLLEEIVESFIAENSVISVKKGLPIGNLTSQLFANIYLNEFDRFIKHELKIKNYIRFADDFIVLSSDKTYLENIVIHIKPFLLKKLSLELHPQKIEIRKLHQGIDFLGYVVFPHYRLVRDKTRKRITRKLKERVEEYKGGTIDRIKLEESWQSYFGVLSHADSYGFSNELKSICID